MLEEKLSYSETARRFDVSNHHRIQDWERIYLTEGPEGFAVERRGRKRKGSLNKQLPKQVEEDLLAEVQTTAGGERILKKLASLGFGERAAPREKAQVVQKLRAKIFFDSSA